jgi:hypothetical protein
MKSDIALVFEGKILDANYIISILEENGISSLLKDNLKSQLYPLYVTYGWIKPVKIFVEKKNERKAREIIDTLIEN